VIVAVALMLGLAALGFTYRVVRGPTLADRIVALDGLLTVAVLGIVLYAVDTGSFFALDAVVVVALVGFVGTSVVARFIERRGV
jgi:multisubunit Na+/H+ antiporter MnhF subunit